MDAWSSGVVLVLVSTAGSPNSGSGDREDAPIVFSLLRADGDHPEDVGVLLSGGLAILALPMPICGDSKHFSS